MIQALPEWTSDQLILLSAWMRRNGWRYPEAVRDRWLGAIERLEAIIVERIREECA